MQKDWEGIKNLAMYEVVKAKFTQNEEIKKMLINTGNCYIEESNTWGDDYWGTVNGVGDNMLGIILMKVREYVKENKSSINPEKLFNSNEVYYD